MIARDLDALRTAAREADYTLTEEALAAALALFHCCGEDARALAALREAAPGYGADEFLLNVAADGTLVGAAEAMVAAARSEGQPFRLWLREATLEDGRPVLLVARWLAHLAGFRHRAVHVFLDHPERSDYTFVQIRSFEKLRGLGSLDVVLGGHVKGTAGLEATVVEELRDELGLDAATDVTDIAPIGAYDYHGTAALFDPQNIEYRAVYRGCLRAEALARVRFADAEVAALCLFALPELRRYLDAYPERCASGLVGSFPLYERCR